MVEAELWPGPVDLIAQSMGGVVALSVALRNPRQVRRLVLTTTSGGVDVADLNPLRLARRTTGANIPTRPSWITEAADRPDRRVSPPSPVPRCCCGAIADPISPLAVGERLRHVGCRTPVCTSSQAASTTWRWPTPGELAPLVAAHLR